MKSRCSHGFPCWVQLAICPYHPLFPAGHPDCILYAYWAVLVVRPTLTLPCDRVHWKTSLMIRALLLLQCPSCLVRLIYGFRDRRLVAVRLLFCEMLLSVYIYIYIYMSVQVCIMKKDIIKDEAVADTHTHTHTHIYIYIYISAYHRSHSYHILSLSPFLSRYIFLVGVTFDWSHGTSTIVGYLRINLVYTYIKLTLLNILYLPNLSARAGYDTRSIF